MHEYRRPQQVIRPASSTTRGGKRQLPVRIPLALLRHMEVLDQQFLQQGAQASCRLILNPPPHCSSSKEPVQMVTAHILRRKEHQRPRALRKRTQRDQVSLERIIPLLVRHEVLPLKSHLDMPPLNLEYRM